MIKLSCKLNTILNKYIIFNSIYFIIGLKSIQIFSKSLMAIYLITGLFFLALFIFNFFTTKKIKKNIIIIFISVIFIFYIFEFYLNLKKNKITNLYNQIINIYYLNKHNSTIASGGYLFLGRENLDILPMSGISNKKTFLCNEDGFFSSYLSDRYGFRNDNNIYDKKLFYSYKMNKTNKTCTNNIGVRFLPITLKRPQESCKERPSYAENFEFEIGGNERVNLMQK